MLFYFAISSLRPQDLSGERERSRELSADLQRLREQLQKAEADLEAASASLGRSEERADSLSRLLRRSDSGSSEAPRSEGEGHAPSVSSAGEAGEAERRLRERLTALEKEVCVRDSHRCYSSSWTVLVCIMLSPMIPRSGAPWESSQRSSSVPRTQPFISRPAPLSQLIRALFIYTQYIL